MKIQRTSPPAHRKPVPQQCTHAKHSHPRESSVFYVRESYVDLPHSVIDLVGDHVDSSVLGAAQGAVSVLAGVRGFQNLRLGGLIHNIEGLGNLALAASSGLGAYESFLGDRGHHHHEFGLAGGLEMLHGAAEVAVGGLELKQGERRSLALTRMAKGAATLTAGFIPGVAPVAFLVHLGATVAVTAMDPTH